MTTSRPPLRPGPQAREVVERGVVEGVVRVALPEVTAYGTRLTSLLVQAKGAKPQWYSARGDRPDLLDAALPDQWVTLAWLRYDGGSRRYVTGLVTVMPPEASGTARTPPRSRPAPRPRSS